ncbi:hypothetical protein KCU93_g5369, partial [Aureobasidium melanogenum]
MSRRPRRRIIACVDGTWYDADGQEGQAHGNITNVFRIYAAIGRGAVKDENGETIEQIIEYFSGIGTNERPLRRLNSGVTGDGYAEQIAEVYKDELWFYGFSRGAYVVTAVAGLFETIGALLCDDVFQETYKKAWDLHKLIQKGCLEGNQGKLFAIKDKSRSCPRIGFLGLLDTVKRVNNDPDTTAHTLAFHKSVRHVRHALALNDTRYHYKPEMYGPISDSDPLQGRSLIQAWFVGTHSDIGGGARDDGLSLYPLQWLLIESQQKGLVLQHNSQTTLIEDPLALVFPSSKQSSPTDQATATGVMWEYQYANGIKVLMQDLRPSHNHGNLQCLPRKLMKKQSGFDIYLIMDIYARFGIELAMRRFEKDINRFRNEQHPNMRDPWVTLQTEALTQTSVKACRILVCGRTGVGKSTLINRVFGVPMTIESHMKQGDHNINESFESEHHPGIIIHDSRGFQAGDNRELEQFRDFIKKRSVTSNPKENLHAIWMCIQTDTDRVVQTSEVKIFGILAEHAPHIPVIVVGTKKDNFLNQQESVARRNLKESGVSDWADLDIQSRERAEQDLQARRQKLKDELGEISDLNLDSIQFLHVSKDDDASIRCLVDQTLELITNDEARLKCIAAQVVDTDPKVRQAIDESIRLLRHGVYASSIGAVTIVGPAVSTPTISRILCDNILKCFGFPKIDPASVNNIMNKIIGWNLYGFLAQQVSQSLTLGAGVAILCLITLGGATPLVAALSLLEVPTAGRMIIKCACDLILILDRAFKHGGKFVTSQEIELACQEYVATTVIDGRSKRK